MRNLREISYNNPKVARFIYGLRKIISIAVREEINDLRIRENELLTTTLQKSRERETKKVAEPVEWRAPLELKSIKNQIKYLEWAIQSSICECFGCREQDSIMVYRNDEWNGEKISRWLCRACSEDFFYKEYKVNDYLSVVYNWGEYFIAINGKKFLTCHIAVITLPIADLEKKYSDMDEFLDNINNNKKNVYLIPNRTEFWVHCSSLQVWAENKYDTRLLHRNIAFPLLKGLSEVGDSLAKQVFKEEIVKRYLGGSHEVRHYLRMEGFLFLLSEQEIKYIINELQQSSNFRIFKRTGRYMCNLCQKYKDDLNIFGNTIDEAEETLSLCGVCLKIVL